MPCKSFLLLFIILVGSDPFAHFVPQFNIFYIYFNKRQNILHLNARTAVLSQPTIKKIRKKERMSLVKPTRRILLFYPTQDRQNAAQRVQTRVLSFHAARGPRCRYVGALGTGSRALLNPLALFAQDQRRRSPPRATQARCGFPVLWSCTCTSMPPFTRRVLFYYYYSFFPPSSPPPPPWCYKTA